MMEKFGMKNNLCKALFSVFVFIITLAAVTPVQAETLSGDGKSKEQIEAYVKKMPARSPVLAEYVDGMWDKLNYVQTDLESGTKRKARVFFTKENVTWKSSNKKVATVKKTSRYGALITAGKPGKVIITVKYGTKTVKINLRVLKKAKQVRTNSKYLGYPLWNSYHKNEWSWGTTLEAGKKYDLLSQSKGYMANMTKKDRARLMKWKSSNSKIISVDKYGYAKVKKEGVCKITCKAKVNVNQWKSKTIKINTVDLRGITFKIQGGFDLGVVDGTWDNFMSVLYDMKENADENHLPLYNQVSVQVTNRSSVPVTLESKIRVTDLYYVEYNEKKPHLTNAEKRELAYADSAQTYLKRSQKYVVGKKTSRKVTYTGPGVLFAPDASCGYKFIFSKKGKRYSYTYYTSDAMNPSRSGYEIKRIR
ncbi:MAG: Ig-like domain-containing protein [Eubacterium sp.]|nr:Ig-like domain-containing protein [Eubacterium sp.]